MVELDFRRSICSRDKLAVWFAFWGERRFRPTYRRICAERDRSYDDMVRVICARLCEEGGYSEVEPALVADGLSALTDGLWLDLLVRPDSMSRERARRITLSYLADVFPRHFTQPAADARADRMDIALDADRAGLARPRLPLRDRGADSLGGRGRAPRGPPAARGREAAQEARDRARLQRDGRAEVAGRPRAPRRRPGRRLGAARPRDQRALLVLLRGRRAGCSRPAPRTS